MIEPETHTVSRDRELKLTSDSAVLRGANPFCTSSRVLARGWKYVKTANSGSVTCIKHLL
jgi:hypothetical protein